MSESLKKEFLDFLEKKGEEKRNNSEDKDRGGSDRRRGGGGGGDPLSKGSSHGGPPTSRNRRAHMSKSLSKEDLKVERVNDFFGEEDEGFAVDWEDPEAGQEGGDGVEATDRRKTHLARSRRLGPGDRRKELMRRTSSRRLLGDSMHSGDNARSRSNSEEEDMGSNNRRGLNRRASNRSLLSTSSHEKPEKERDMFAEFERKASTRSLLAAEDDEAPNSFNKMTVKSLKEDLKEGNGDMEMSFSELPKEWQVGSNPAVASFLPSQRAPNRSKSGNNNPRHRRNSLNGVAPRAQIQRRLSSRGGALMKEEGQGAAARTPRRHSLMGGMPADGMDRQRSTRGLGVENAGEGQGPTTTRRSTMVRRRMSNGGNSCRDLGVGSRAPVTSVSLTGETIAAMGGATIRW